MTQRIIASFAAFAVIFTAAVVSSSAQTAGASSLEQIGYMLKPSYAFSLNAGGSVLTLRSLASTDDVITLTRANHNDMLLQTVLGDLSALPKAQQGVVRETIGFMNTTLSIGTITIGKSGQIAMEHHLNPGFVSPTEMTFIVARFSAEASRRRAQLFS